LRKSLYESLSPWGCFRVLALLLCHSSFFCYHKHKNKKSRKKHAYGYCWWWICGCKGSART
jgi:hypothetical protein